MDGNVTTLNIATGNSVVVRQIWDYICPVCNVSLISYDFVPETDVWQINLISENAWIDGDPMDNPPQVRCAIHNVFVQIGSISFECAEAPNNNEGEIPNTDDVVVDLAAAPP